jgi:hypothetical protein
MLDMSLLLTEFTKKIVRYEILQVQLTMLWYRSTNLLAGLILNIPGNTRERLKLTEFWASLYLSYNR